MDELRKVTAKETILTAQADNSVKITKEIAAISLNPDGFVDIKIPQDLFVEAIRDAFDPATGIGACIVAGDCGMKGSCGGDCNGACVKNMVMGLTDIKILWEKGILPQSSLTAEQLKAIKAVRG